VNAVGKPTLCLRLREISPFGAPRSSISTVSLLKISMLWTSVPNAVYTSSTKLVCYRSLK
jgi:hypothetical protein